MSLKTTETSRRGRGCLWRWHNLVDTRAMAGGPVGSWTCRTRVSHAEITEDAKVEAVCCLGRPPEGIKVRILVEWNYTRRCGGSRAHLRSGRAPIRAGMLSGTARESILGVEGKTKIVRAVRAQAGAVLECGGGSGHSWVRSKKRRKLLTTGCSGLKSRRGGVLETRGRMGGSSAEQRRLLRPRRGGCRERHNGKLRRA